MPPKLSPFWFLFGTALLFSSACSVGPDYSIPELSIPTEYSDSTSSPSEEIALPESRWLDRLADTRLRQYLALARAENFSLREAQGRVAEVAALKQISASNLAPEIGLGGEYRRSQESGNLALFPGGIIESRYSVGAQLSWEIDLFGRIRRDVEAAKADLGSAIAAQESVSLSILSEVASQYISLRTAQLRRDAVNRNLSAAQESLTLTRKKFAAGLSSELDVVRAQALVAETESNIPSIESSARMAMHRLAVLTGQAPQSLVAELSAASPLPQPEALPQLGVPADLLRRRPDLIIAERELAAETARVGVAVGSLFPKFSLSGEAGFRSAKQSSFFNEPSEVFAIAPGFTWPILSWRNLMARVDAAEARTQQKLNAYKNTVLTALAEVEDALVSYKNLEQKRLYVQTLLGANRKAASLAAQQYQEGLIDFIVKLDTDRALFAAEELSVATEGELAQQFIMLCKSLGGGWASPPAPLIEGDQL
jgi:multidrug efflux system outer membrane protein